MDPYLVSGNATGTARRRYAAPEGCGRHAGRSFVGARPHRAAPTALGSVTMSEGSPVARRAQVLLAWLAGLPRTGVFLFALAVVLVGLFAPGLVGAIMLLLIAAGLVAVLRVTWPRLLAARRAMQLLLIAVLVIIAVVKLA
ncbi:DUF6703 family protein [Actinocatenispora sera]|uniref:DUF6703 family protein n=1 Tax=Actinocatenispora sera TaxID=390989 RepID=UPI0031402C5C